MYSHIDPKNKKIVYIGRGQGARAFTTSDRYGPHKMYLSKLVDEGYIPLDWVNIIKRGISKQQSIDLEYSLIKNYRPLYNRKSGEQPKLTKNEVNIIKTLYSTGNHSYDDLAFMMDCSRTTIYRIIRKIRGDYVGK